MLRRLTRELARQEVATWKKVIRVISHELNNALGPIASMAHTGRVYAERGDKDKLLKIFSHHRRARAAPGTVSSAATRASPSCPARD
jgi:two-component system nitrogen regulation sensor histidine kinase NtrY